MRIAAVGFLILATSLHAQPAVQDDVDAVLRGWEKAMNEAPSFAAVVNRKTVDALINEEFAGYVILKMDAPKKGAIQARLDLTNAKNKNSFEKIICTDGKLYQFNTAKQIVLAQDMQPNALRDNSLLSFVLGMSPKDARANFDVQFEPNAPKDGYFYLRLTPKQATDFTVAQLAIHRSNHLLASVRYLQRGGGVTTWTFTNIKTNGNWPAAQFEPTLPNKEWRFETVRPVR